MVDPRGDEGGWGARDAHVRLRRPKRDALAGVNVLALRPVRIAAWEERDGRVVLIRPGPTTSGLRGLWDRLLHQLSARRIRLDEIGSAAWLALDGDRTVAQVAVDLRADFGAAVEPAEDRLGHLVRVLRREGFLVYPGVDEHPSGPE